MDKELIQCIAFAHFAVNKYNVRTEKEHEQSFYDLFDLKKPSQKKISQYKKYLSNNFKFDLIYNKWKHTTTPTGNTSVDITVKIVYDVAKQFYLSNLISRNFSNYEFLDQDDQFVKLIKYESLNRIIKVLKLPYKVDILSSADMYIVKKNFKRKIQSRFTNEIIKKSDLYLINNYDKYNKILIDYWKSHSLFGVSLKLPVNNQQKNIKIVGVPEHILNKKMQKKIDPFSKFLSLLSDKKTNITNLIDDTIEILDFDLSHASWKFPYRFKYKKINLYPSDVDFNLMSWTKGETAGGGSAGFNGSFVNTVGYSSQWVGGTGIETLESFISKYSEYKKIMNELISIRKKALNYTFTGSIWKSPNLNEQIQTDIQINLPMKMSRYQYNSKTQKTKKTYLKGKIGNIDYGSGGNLTARMDIRNIQSLYSSALREISEPRLNIGSIKNRNISKLFEEYEKITQNTNMFNLYKQTIVNLVKKQSLDTDQIGNSALLNSFYEHSQLSYYMIRGGKNFIKKKIFLTIFGVITKKGYVFVNERDLNSSKLENIIRSNAAKVLTKEIKNFDTVPHFYMS